MHIDLAVPRLSRWQAWLRVCRPLLWWLVLFHVALGYQWHQRLLQKTRLVALVTLSGNDVRYGTKITLDGQPYELGQRVSLGNHELVIQCPKADNFRTNLFVWYGMRNLGSIALRRAEGVLQIEATPPASMVKVRSRHWQKDIKAASVESISVPTDDYTVTAVYPHFTIEKIIRVSAGQRSACGFAPAVGVLQATSVQRGARFELRRASDSQTESRILEQGDLPVSLPILEVGRYRLQTAYRGVVENRLVEITSNQTNKLEVDFPLGRVVVESTPAGATVLEGGAELGKTPLTLEEVPVGVWRGELVFTNYVPMSVAVEVLAKETATFRTNLVRLSFARAMELGERMKQELSTNFTALIEAFTEAVKDDPGNTVAVEKLQKARAGQAMVLAESKAQRGDYAGALQDTETALALLPENAELQRLVAEYKQTIQDNQSKADETKRNEAVAQRQRRPREYFAEVMSTTSDSDLFDEQELKVSGSAEDLRMKTAEALGSGLIKFNIEENRQAFEEGFFIRCKMRTLGGFTRCYIVGGQTANGEVTIRFKVFEYILPDKVILTGLFKELKEDQMIPVHRSRLSANDYDILAPRRVQHIPFVTDRLRKAAGK